LRVMLIILVTLCFGAFCAGGCFHVAEPQAAPLESPEPEPQQAEPVAEDSTSVLVACVGDILMHGPLISAGKRPDGSYDFTHFFAEVQHYIEEADVAIANLEGTISTSERGYSGYPCFKAPEEIIWALKEAGFNLVVTANNHSFDGGEFGVIHTIDVLEKAGMHHTGTARTAEERDQVLVLEKNDIRLAFLNYTYGTNGMEVNIPRDKIGYMVNYLHDTESIKLDIERAREREADVIIAMVHWGPEYVRKPDEFQQRLAEDLFSLGVDIIFGSHPHVLQPMRFGHVVRDGGQAEVFVAYSLGNFISNQRNEMIRYTDSGMILTLRITKQYGTGAMSISDVRYTPTWVQRYTQNGLFQYRVLPVGMFMPRGLPEQDSQRLEQVWEETTSLIGNERFRIVR